MLNRPSGGGYHQAEHYAQHDRGEHPFQDQHARLVALLERAVSHPAHERDKYHHQGNLQNYLYGVVHDQTWQPPTRGGGSGGPTCLPLPHVGGYHNYVRPERGKKVTVWPVCPTRSWGPWGERCRSRGSKTPKNEIVRNRYGPGVDRYPIRCRQPVPAAKMRDSKPAQTITP